MGEVSSGRFIGEQYIWIVCQIVRFYLWAFTYVLTQYIIKPSMFSKLLLWTLAQFNWRPLHVIQITTSCIPAFLWFLGKLCRCNIWHQKWWKNQRSIPCLRTTFTFVLTMNQSPSVTGTLEWHIHSADSSSRTAKQYFQFNDMIDECDWLYMKKNTNL